MNPTVSEQKERIASDVADQLIKAIWDGVCDPASGNVENNDELHQRFRGVALQALTEALSIKQPESLGEKEAASDSADSPRQKELPSRPLCHVFLLPLTMKAARACGYTLALHGTLQRDFDLVAIPWTEEAKSAEELVEAIRGASGGMKLAEWEEKVHQNPQDKPHGRRAWTIILGSDYVIDLSVMPRFGLGILPDIGKLE